jgi:type IV fimbrial biogenesis protein FimT
MLTLHTYKHRQEGFTLAELLVTLAVGALVLSLGVPSYAQFTQDAQQVRSANDLLSTLHVARDLAVTRNARVTVCPSKTGLDCDTADWQNGWIVFVDEDGDRTVDADETVTLAGDELGGVQVASAAFSQFLIFRPNGRVMVDNTRQNSGEFTLCDKRGPTYARVLVIGTSGRPQVSKYSADGSLPTCPTV